MSSVSGIKTLVKSCPCLEILNISGTQATENDTYSIAYARGDDVAPVKHVAIGDWSALHKTASEGDTVPLHRLIQSKRIYVNIQKYVPSESKSTDKKAILFDVPPVYQAIGRGFIEASQLLIEAGASLDLPSTLGTAYHVGM